MLYNEKVAHETSDQAQMKEKLKRFANRFINEYLANAGAGADTAPELDWTNAEASLTISGDERLENSKEEAAEPPEPQNAPEEKRLEEILDEQDLKKSKGDSTFDLDSSESVDLPNDGFSGKISVKDAPRQNSSLIKEVISGQTDREQRSEDASGRASLSQEQAILVDRIKLEIGQEIETLINQRPDSDSSIVPTDIYSEITKKCIVLLKSAIAEYSEKAQTPVPRLDPDSIKSSSSEQSRKYIPDELDLPHALVAEFQAEAESPCPQQMALEPAINISEIHIQTK